LSVWLEYCVDLSLVSDPVRTYMFSCRW